MIRLGKGTKTMGKTYRQWSLVIAGASLGLFAAFLTGLPLRATSAESHGAAPLAHLAISALIGLWAVWRLAMVGTRLPNAGEASAPAEKA